MLRKNFKVLLKTDNYIYTVKKATAIGLIIVMVSQCFIKLGILAYYSLHQRYIAEVLCINKANPRSMCHGQCFLKKKLQMADETEKKPVSLGKDKIEIPYFIVSRSLCLADSGVLAASFVMAYDKNPSSGFKPPVYHPPLIFSQG